MIDFRSLNKKLAAWHFFFWLGLVLALVATTLEVARGRNANFIVYSDATGLFWDSISPYTQAFVDVHKRYFLYPPSFCIFFTPFHLLPSWLGPFVWNVFNYLMFALAIKTLPERFDAYKRRIFLFLLPILVQSLFCFQYNVVVGYLFIFAFSLLERGKGFWAVVLIMLSATTKVYGGVELAMLLMYPRPVRNIAYAIVVGAVMLALPLVNVSLDALLSLYGDMASILSQHNTIQDYVGLLYARGLKGLLLPNAMLVQLVVLVLLAVGYFARYKRWGDLRFRTQCLALLMGYIILWSDCPETHTYVIALAGWQLAFWLHPSHKKWEWVLFWFVFVNFSILPSDIFFPKKYFVPFHKMFWFDVYGYTVCWLLLAWRAFFANDSKCQTTEKTLTA